MEIIVWGIQHISMSRILVKANHASKGDQLKIQFCLFSSVSLSTFFIIIVTKICN